MSEQQDFEHLTDEDYEAIGAIVERGVRRQHGEFILAMTEGAEQRRREQDRALLDAIARARLEQEGGQD